MTLSRVLDEVDGLLRAGRTAEAADALAALLTRHFEYKYDAREAIASMPASVLDRHAALWRAAALNELEEGRFAEAASASERALLIARGSEIADCLLDQALIARDRTDWQGSRELLREAAGLELTGQQRLRLLNMEAVDALHRSDLAAARSLFIEIEKAASAAGDRASFLTAVVNRGLGVERIQGRFEQMIACADQIVRYYGSKVPTEDRVYELRLRAEALVHLADDEAPKWLQLLVDLAEETGNPNAGGYGLALSALWAAERGRVSDARELARKAAGQALPHNASELIAAAALARCAAIEGAAAQALRLCQEAAQAEVSDDRKVLAYNECAYGQLLCGRLDAAFEWASKARKAAQAIGAAFELVRALVIAANVRIDRSDAGFAVEMIESHGWKQTLNSRIPAAMPLFLCRSLELGVEPERICGWRGERTEPALLLRVFGGLAVISQAGPLDRAAWTRPKARSLFALLLARLPNPVDSQQVQDELWPDLGVEEGRNALRVAASYVRKALGVDAIRLEGAQMRLALPSPHWVDHIELRRAVASRDAERCSRALDNLKDGEPLADFAELWCLEAREALQLLRSQAQDIAGISTLRDKP